MRIVLRTLTASISLSVCQFAWADMNLHFNGFATLAATRNNDSVLGFRRDISREEASLDNDIEFEIDSLLGLQIGGSLTEKLDWTVQGVVRERSEQNLDESIEWAYLRYMPNDHSTVRLGRMGVDVFMLSDYRNVGYAYHWVRPPTDFYGFVPLYKVDGIDYLHNFELGDGELSAKLFAGYSESEVPTAAGGVVDEETFTLDIEPVWGISLDYRLNDWRWRVSHNEVHFESNPPFGALYDALELASGIWPDALKWRDDLQLQDDTARYSNLGVSYDNGLWLLQAELARIDADKLLSPRLWAAYATAARRFGTFTAYATVAGTSPLDNPERITLPDSIPPAVAELLDPLVEGTEGAASRGRVDQVGVGVGLRWDFAPRMALKVQWDHWKVSREGSLLWLHDDLVIKETRHAPWSDCRTACTRSYRAKKPGWTSNAVTGATNLAAW